MRTSWLGFNAGHVHWSDIARTATAKPYKSCAICKSHEAEKLRGVVTLAPFQQYWGLADFEARQCSRCGYFWSWAVRPVMFADPFYPWVTHTDKRKRRREHRRAAANHPRRNWPLAPGGKTVAQWHLARARSLGR